MCNGNFVKGFQAVDNAQTLSIFLEDCEPAENGRRNLMVRIPRRLACFMILQTFAIYSWGYRNISQYHRVCSTTGISIGGKKSCLKLPLSESSQAKA